MRELGLSASVGAIAAHYHGIIDGYVVDDADAIEARMLDIPTLTTTALMRTLGDRERLAGDVLKFADSLAAAHNSRLVSVGTV
jgi:LPPG:FO 2-phospho-L-lactate transferase